MHSLDCPKISVIVPIYNVEKYLRKCIDSIIGQSYTNLEIVLVDDGSNDACASICEEYKNEDDRIITIHKQNEGLGLTRNAGIKSCKGNYICFVDSDDYLESDHIEKLFRCLDSFSADVCYSGHTAVIGNKRIIKPNIYKGLHFEKDSILKELIPKMCGSQNNDGVEMSSCMALYKMEIIKANSVRFLSERKFISEDLLFNLDYLACCKRVCFCDSVGYYYVSNINSLTRSYRKDRLEKQIIMTKEVLKRVDDIGILQLCEQRIYNNFMTWVRAIIRMEQLNFVKSGYISSMKSIRNICNNEFVIHIMKKDEEIGVKTSSKFIHAMIKRKHVFLLWNVMMLKNLLGI